MKTFYRFLFAAIAVTVTSIAQGQTMLPVGQYLEGRYYTATPGYAPNKPARHNYIKTAFGYYEVNMPEGKKPEDGDWIFATIEPRKGYAQVIKLTKPEKAVILYDEESRRLRGTLRQIVKSKRISNYFEISEDTYVPMGAKIILEAHDMENLVELGYIDKEIEIIGIPAKLTKDSLEVQESNLFVGVEIVTEKAYFSKKNKARKAFEKSCFRLF